MMEALFLAAVMPVRTPAAVAIRAAWILVAIPPCDEEVSVNSADKNTEKQGEKSMTG